MTLIKNKQILNDINAYLLIVFAFILPFTVAGGNFIAGLIVIVWLLRGSFKSDYNELKSNKVILAVLIFYTLHIIGLIWTEDMSWGLHILKKESKFLFLPIFMLFVKKEHIQYYIYSFLAAMSITEILSYGIWLEIIPAFKSATISNPTPFMSHISYNPFLALAIYLLLRGLLFNKSLTISKKIIYVIFAITMSINMFITGGRGGQVMYFAVIVILLFQYFNTSKLKAVIVSSIILPTIFVLAYNTSNIFKDRVNLAINNVVNYSDNKSTSVGLRITFALNSFEIIKEHPFIGVGTGDYVVEYKRINDILTPNLSRHAQPHNMYTLELVQFGILGLLSLLYILYIQIKMTYCSNDNKIKYIGVALPILFSIIMLSDSYLLGHYTSMLFIFFSSFLYKEYAEV